MALTPLESLQALWPPKRWREVTVVVGVSGGADSVALLYLLHQLSKGESIADSTLKSSAGGELIVAHYNHRLRGSESEQDECFVRGLARELGLNCVVGDANNSLDGSADLFKVVQDSEESWRNQRYAFFEKVAHDAGARYVALAHHGDDRIETVLHHILRGTGISGLAALKPFRGLGEDVVIARPLLCSNRNTIEAYLAGIGGGYRVDQSNASNRFTRNKIRNQLIPYLEQLGFNHHGASILRLADQAQEIDDWIDKLAVEAMDKIVFSKGGEVRVHCGQLFEQPRPVQRQVLARLWRQNQWPLGPMNAQAWNRLLALATSSEDERGAVHLPGGVLAKRSGIWIHLGIS